MVKASSPDVLEESIADLSKEAKGDKKSDPPAEEPVQEEKKPQK